MNPRWLLKMSLWARKPPSEKRVIFVFAIILVCLVLVGIERFFGWPEALTPNRTGGGRLKF